MSSTWYRLGRAGVYDVAYSVPGSEAGAAHPDLAYRPSDHFQSAWNEATWFPAAATTAVEPIFRDEPRLLYPYRLRVGAEWVEFDLGFFRRISRVDRIEEVTVAAGSYTAYVIVSEFELEGVSAEGLLMSAYVVPHHGMVLREVEGRFQGYDENGAPAGWRLAYELVELIEG